MTGDPPLSRTLDPAAFYSLYRGALAAESVKRRLARCYAVLLTGRLGLRPGEVLHCHEGWVDWGRGELRVPALDPCACRECWAGARARQAAGDERPLDEIVTDEQWSPASDAGARTVAFGWSERISAVLASAFDYIEVLDYGRAELRELVREAAEDAEGIDPEGLTPHVLRATGGRFLADVGFDATSVQHLLGLEDRETAEAFVRASGQRTSAGLHRVFDRDAVGPEVPPADPAKRFPIVCDPAPFSREPFSPADYGPTERRERASDEAGRTVRNPRPSVALDGFDYDPDDHRLPGQADPAGGQFSETADAEAADVAALRDWIVRRDASLRSESELGGTIDPAPGMDPADASVSPGEGPPPEPDPASAATGDGGRAVPADASGPPAAANEGIAGGWDAEAGPAALGAGEPETVSEAVTDPVVASFGTRFVAPGVGEGPVEGRVVLGQDELLFVRPGSVDDLTDPGVEYALFALDDVVDVVLDAGPMDETLGVVRRAREGHEVAAVEIGGQRRRDFRMALFRNALHVSQMQVTHPAREGGRVTDESPTLGMLYIDPERVRLTPVGSDATLVEIDLSEVVHVERSRQEVAGDRQPALAIRQFVDGRSVTSLVGSNSIRTLSLFERFVRSDYRERLEAARSLSIPDREKEILVALYAAGDAVDLTSVFARDTETLRDLVSSLESKGLVTAEDISETELTAKGRLVVSDRLDDVNE